MFDRLSKFLRSLGNRVDAQDVFVFGGLATAGYGIAQIYPPAAFIAVGVSLFWLGLRA